MDEQGYLATVELEAIDSGTIRMFCQVESELPHRIIFLRMRPGPGPGLVVGTFEEIVGREPDGERLSRLDDELTGWLDDELERARQHQPFVGFGAAITRGDEVVYLRTLGYRDVAANARTTHDTVFSIGSVSKVLTGIGVTRLVQSGRIGLDDEVNRHLRAFRVVAPTSADPPVTVRHRLTHTGGAYSLGGEFAAPGEVAPTLPEYYGAEIACRFPAGSQGLYSNDGFAVLGQVIEDVASEPLDAFMRREVFDPAGMDTTTYTKTPAVQQRLATAYEIVFGEVNELVQRDMVLKPAGSVYSSLHDMARLAQVIGSNGRGERGQVLAADTLASMMIEHGEAAGSAFARRGLAFGMALANGHKLVCHNGGFPGFYSALSVAPEIGIGVVLLTNTSSGAPAALAQSVHRHVLARLA